MQGAHLGLAGYCWNYQRIEPWYWWGCDGQNLGMYPNSILLGVATRCHRQCPVVLKPNGYHHQLRLGNGRCPHPLASDGSGVPTTTEKMGRALQRQLARSRMNNTLGLLQIVCHQALCTGTGPLDQGQQSMPFNDAPH